MKTKTLSLSVAMGLLGVGLTSGLTYANSQVLNSDPINVEGYLHEERAVTDHELEQIKSEVGRQKNEIQLQKEKSKGFKQLVKTTEKLSETTEEYLDDKKDAQGQIAEYNQKIKCLMEQNPGRDCDKFIKKAKQDEVSLAQAAPSQVATEVAPSDSGNAFEKIKLIPYVGATQFNGEVERLESELAAGIRLESNITQRFSMGVGLNYNRLTTEDFATQGFMGQGWHTGYMNAYGRRGRQIEYSSFGLDIYAKFYLTNANRFKPYVGGGLGYNRGSLSYAQNDPYNNMQFGYNFGNERYNTSYASGMLMMGSEVMITQMVGLNLEAQYSSGLGTAISSRAARSEFNAPDQKRLRDLGDEIINANALSIFVGVVVAF